MAAEVQCLKASKMSRLSKLWCPFSMQMLQTLLSSKTQNLIKVLKTLWKMSRGMANYY